MWDTPARNMRFEHLFAGRNAPYARQLWDFEPSAGGQLGPYDNDIEEGTIMIIKHVDRPTLEHCTLAGVREKYPLHVSPDGVPGPHPCARG